jgi:hypothetical protein
MDFLSKIKSGYRIFVPNLEKRLDLMYATKTSVARVALAIFLMFLLFRGSLIALPPTPNGKKHLRYQIILSTAKSIS